MEQPPLARAYRIETERLIIRCYEPSDAQGMHEAIIRSTEHLLPWLPWVQHEPKTLEDRLGLIRLFRGQFDLGLDYTFGIFEKEKGAYIGGTGLHTRIGKNAREIGYWIDVNHIGKGYATEAVTGLLRTAFDIEHLSRIEIRCDPVNTRSRHVPEKLGFRMEGIIQRTLYDNLVDTMIWAISKEDYAASPMRRILVKAFDLAGNRLLLR